LPEQAAPMDFLDAQVLLVRLQKDPVVQFPSPVQLAGKQLEVSMQVTPPGQAAVVGEPSLQFPTPSQLAGVLVS